MSNDFEDEIKCPYCNYEFGDSWEYNNCDESEIECHECNKKFLLSVNFSTTYSTHRKDCENDNHDFDNWNTSIIDHKTCDRYNAENFLNRQDWAPHKLLIRNCKNCEETQYKRENIN